MITCLPLSAFDASSLNAVKAAFGSATLCALDRASLEIFLRPDGQTESIGLRVTPNNQQLQLRIPSTEALRRAYAANVFEEFLFPGNVFHSVTWVQPENRKWFVFAAIPAIMDCSEPRLNAGSRWQFSFSRYVYNRSSGELVISSTFPHAKADFHIQQKWGMILFCEL